MADRVVTEPALAKINPFLRVLGRRSDGYHDIETLILPLSMHDQVSVSTREEGIGLRVVGPRADEVPQGEDNLVMKAARKLAEAAGERRGANIVLHKTIPVAAGLGGGSSDAAAVLRALDQLWELGLGKERLSEIGAGVGSDVPALVQGGPVISRGRGEIVEPIEVALETWWVIVPLGFPVAASDAYRWWDREGRWPRRRRSRPHLNDFREALSQRDLYRTGSLLFNDLESSVGRHHPEISSAKESVLQGNIGWMGVSFEGGMRSAVLGAMMVGSGPTVAGLCADANYAGALSLVYRRKWPDTMVCRA